MQDKEFKDLQRQIHETRQLAEENHELLDKTHRMLVWGRVFSILYWVLIIGVAVGALYFLEPYWDNLVEAYENIQVQLEAVSNFGG